MADDFWGKLTLVVLFGFIVLYGAYHLGRWHQRTAYISDNCEPALVCKQVKSGLECRRVGM